MTKPPGFLAVVPVLAVAILTAGCAALSSSSQAAPAPPATSAPSAAHSAKAAAKHAPDPSAACGARPNASGDIYVRMLSPGVDWEAQELGGEWVWNSTLGKCLTSVQMIIATAPAVAGSCTQVGYVKDNPGYDVNGTPAPSLKAVTAQAGPAC